VTSSSIRFYPCLSLVFQNNLGYCVGGGEHRFHNFLLFYGTSLCSAEGSVVSSVNGLMILKQFTCKGT
jgi:hypothetical protein